MTTVWSVSPRFGGGSGLKRIQCAVERHVDAAFVKSAAGLPNETDVRQNFVGTATVARATLRNHLLGYQPTPRRSKVSHQHVAGPILKAAESALTPLRMLHRHPS